MLTQIAQGDQNLRALLPATNASVMEDSGDFHDRVEQMVKHLEEEGQE